MSDKYALIAAEKADPTSSYPVALMCAWLAVIVHDVADEVQGRGRN